MEDKEIKLIELYPEKGMCWVTNNGYKFINTNGKEGLPLYIKDTEEARQELKENYTQIKI